MYPCHAAAGRGETGAVALDDGAHVARTADLSRELRDNVAERRRRLDAFRLIEGRRELERARGPLRRRARGAGTGVMRGRRI